MKVRKFGKIEYEVFPLGFGAMNLPNVPYEQAEEALNHALDRGINYIDTAAGYRNSEEIIGNAISHRRKEYFLATKTNKRDYDGAKQELERSLQRMKTDVIDLIQVHYTNYPEEFERVMGPDGAYRALLEAREQGMIRYIGISGHRPELLARWVQQGGFDQVLFHLNLAQPFAVTDLLPVLKELNLGRVAMKPLSGGFIQPVRDALRYPVSQDIHVVISGMVSAKEVDENLAAFETEVEEEERLRLEELAGELGSHHCRRCNYCSCPVGIKIPDVMISSRVRRVLGLLPKGQTFYENQRDKLLACADYEPCREQPLCQEKCPYHLPIAQVVRETAASLSV